MDRLFNIFCFATYQIAVIAFLFLHTDASACVICIDFPEKTAADYLIESNCVILARQSEAIPYDYSPQNVLKGTFDSSEIDLLVDSTTRRILTAYPELQVVLVQKNRGGDWQSLGIASTDYLEVVRRIVHSSTAWSGKDGAQQRWKFFLPLFDHHDPMIRQLAYLELGRAPYSIIRQLGRVTTRETILPILSDPKYLEWKSLAILLLAQSENSDDKQLIRDSFQSAYRLGITTNLAAWVTAFVEVEGASAIEIIEDQYFRQSGRSAIQLLAVVKALSMLGSQEDSRLQDRIVASYGELLKHSPQCAPQVAQDLDEWGRTELIEELSAIAAKNMAFEIAGRQSIQPYLSETVPTEETQFVKD